jgi:hypothetical protein
MATATRARVEREAILAAVKEIKRKSHAPGAVTSFRTAVLVLGAWLGLAALALAALASADSVREAELVRRSLAFPAALVWLASAFGLVWGLRALVRPKGRKALAALAALANGVLCAAPPAALLLWMK